MKHYGDIQKIDGHKVPLVDIITAGSPCQDLSIAGKRAGLSGERSGLFMESIRIIKEMHDESRRTNQPVRPRFLVFENVTGVLSSNDGEDFRTILEEVIHIVDPDSDVPRLAEGQRVGAEWGAFWETDGLSLGKYTTVSFGEFPKEGVDCALWQILEVNPLPKYSLSEKACRGILNRAEKKGKELPKTLKEALIQQITRTNPTNM